jgi:hypothetical protein
MFATPSRSVAHRQWADAWFHSDLVGIPVSLALVGVIALSVGPYLVVGELAGLVIGKTFFALALLGLLGLLIRWGRRGDKAEAIQLAPGAGHRRLLVLANAGLEDPAARSDVCGLVDRADEAMIVAPVVAASWLHALADDVDAEFEAAQRRVDAVVAALRRAGVKAEGRADIASPTTALVDGLREFAPTEVLVLPSREKGWANADTLARQIRTQAGPGVGDPGRSQVPLTAA